ncbi:hypothetical protein [Domibacillus aminovorans]|uniref:Uncharacterized protein n=1 Tax=Domibacillus aminovorans TaxID=29332 RepID=A0A177L6Z6_9BACI|nr:hypothetical protein [Domibacillus aminovorans]OAH61136.1 hypothetical protein AWH49_02295 [Domibacillus aminovorans]
MKNLTIAIFILACLILFMFGIDKMMGLSMRDAIRNVTNPFYVMHVAEMMVFCVLIAMLFVRPFLDFHNKRKENK